MVDFSAKEPPGNPPIKYNDGYFRIALCVIAAHIMVTYNLDEDFFEILLTVPYIRGFLGSFVIALLLTQYIHYITRRLDGRYDWHKHTLPRLFWQGLLGFAAPAILAFILAALFFWLFDKNIFHTSYLRQDYTLVVLMLLVFNIYYFGLNSFLRFRRAVSKNLPLEDSNGAATAPGQQAGTKEIIMVETPTRSIPIRSENTCYCFILSGNVFLRTFDMASLNESHQLSYKMKDIEALFDAERFFRINRQMVVSFDACKYYRPGKGKTLEVVLDPPLYQKGTKIPPEIARLSIVSEDRVQAFKAWMDR